MVIKEVIINQEIRITLRMPSEMRDFLAAKAERYGSSQNAEILRLIRNRMDQESATAGEGLMTATPAVAPDCAALPGDTHQP
jgi:hypothetical protein